MKIKNLTLGLALTGVSIFAQQNDIYKSSYTANFSIEDHQSSLGTGVETSQGVRIIIGKTKCSKKMGYEFPFMIGKNRTN